LDQQVFDDFREIGMSEKTCRLTPSFAESSPTCQPSLPERQRCERDLLSNAARSSASISSSKSPEGADAYVMKAIIHDWDDESALKILKNCRRAVRDDGKLLVMDNVMKPANAPDPELGRFIDLSMLILATGRERTEAEFASLLRAGVLH